jgi:hypothetical protein
VGKDRQAIHSTSIEVTMSTGTLHAILEDFGYLKIRSMFPVGPMSTDRHIQTVLHVNNAGKFAVIVQ